MSQAQIDRPIFLVGTGRCGSTVVYQMMSHHPRVAWLSGLGDRYPTTMAMHHAVVRALSVPVLSAIVRRGTMAGECYDTWEHLARGFSRPMRDLTAQDVSERSRRRLLAAMGRVTTSKRPRLLFKITGWPRIGFLHEVFADARFIHVVRDGRAVANSLMNVDFWRGWEGPSKWRWGELDEAQRREWERYDRSFVALAGINWKIVTDAVEESKKALGPESFLEIKYEDVCARPWETFEQILEFTDLPRTAAFERTIRDYPLRNTNAKYLTDLSPAQQQVLNEVLGSHLKRYGYDEAGAEGGR